MGNKIELTKRRGVAIIFLPFAFCLLPFALRQSQAQDNAIQNGRRLFSGSCGMSYCHGYEGIGGGGPKLKDRAFSANYLRKLITEGVPGTTMPGFKDRHSKEEIEQIIAFIQSVGPNKGAPPAKPANEHLNPTPQVNAPPTVKLSVAAVTSAANASLSGKASAGRELFFAATSDCRSCHSVNNVGGKAASDLSRLRELAPREILQRILAPTLSDDKYATLTLTLRGGEQYTGIKRDEDQTNLRLYDLSQSPPISRGLLKTEIARTEKLNTLACPGNYAEKFTFKQLLDLISFLKSADPDNPASVSLKDLF
jgi:mono/diheme cytochrome c family protein